MDWTSPTSALSSQRCADAWRTAVKASRLLSESSWLLFAAFRASQREIQRAGCGTGNSCGIYDEESELEINYEFPVMIDGFDKDGFPSFTAADAAEEDRALNAAYQRELTNHPAKCGTDLRDFCSSEVAFRSSERAWLRYRDAWIAFGIVDWPHTTADSLRTYLAMQRLKQLR
jgi:uncharacterized protein YecT (DUF1311 family)